MFFTGEGNMKSMTQSNVRFSQNLSWNMPKSIMQGRQNYLKSNSNTQDIRPQQANLQITDLKPILLSKHSLNGSVQLLIPHLVWLRFSSVEDYLIRQVQLGQLQKSQKFIIIHPTKQKNKLHELKQAFTVIAPSLRV